ncbi:MAG: protein kinase [Candidatus Saganbacteria bacterium]|nr:protein kinase [Candidatus Saganbacteria bacterium]
MLVNLRTGSRFGKYTIKGLINEGGCSTVYRAQHPSIGENVALKVIDTFRGPSILQDFLTTEKNVLLAVGRSEKKGLFPELFEACRYEGKQFLSMEYIDGVRLVSCLVSLQALKQAFPLYKTILITLSISKGLSVLHQAGYVYSDMSPHNIMLENFSVRLLDFGACQKIGKYGKNFSRPSYRSPEEISRDQTLQPSSDIFILTVILWEIINAKPLFRCSFEKATLERILYGPVSELKDNFFKRFPGLSDLKGKERKKARRRARRLRKRLNAFIKKGLEKDQADRFQTTEEFDKALRLCLLPAVQLAPYECEENGLHGVRFPMTQEEAGTGGFDFGKIDPEKIYVF